MPKSGPRTVHRYTLEFKLTAVRLSQQPEMHVKTVAAALAIHPCMLSKWRKGPGWHAAWPCAPHSNRWAARQSRAGLSRQGGDASLLRPTSQSPAHAPRDGTQSNLGRRHHLSPSRGRVQSYFLARHGGRCSDGSSF